MDGTKPLAEIMRGDKVFIAVPCVPSPVGVNFIFQQDTLSHMTFHCNARYFLLTYAQCGNLDPWAVSDHLSELRGECIVAREAHADGGTHLHAFVDFGRKFRSRRTSVFDVHGRHPNVSATHSTPREGFDYACKDGDILAGGLERPAGSDRLVKRNGWHDIVASNSREEFFDMLVEYDPRALCTSFTQLCKYADWRYREDPEPYRTPDGVAIDPSAFPELTEWAREAVQSCNVRKCITPGTR